jgi:hypothetical protein
MLLEINHVNVPPSNAHETIIPWKITKYAFSDPYTSVWVDVVKLDAMLRLPEAKLIYVGFAGENGILGKYKGVDEFVRSGRAMEMSTVGIYSAPGGRRIPYIKDGRHRFAWMRDHGARAVPVTVLESEAREIASIVGTSDRICRVTMQYIPAWNPLIDEEQPDEPITPIWEKASKAAQWYDKTTAHLAYLTRTGKIPKTAWRKFNGRYDKREYDMNVLAKLFGYDRYRPFDA